MRKLPEMCLLVIPEPSGTQSALSVIPAQAGTQSALSVILREVLPTEESAFIVVRTAYEPMWPMSVIPEPSGTWRTGCVSFRQNEPGTVA